ncbi:MAG: cellulase family glycosylhydrolase, partial [Ignavibacteriaceae bacterium]
MKKIAYAVSLLFSFLLIHCGTSSQFESFVTAKKDKLMEGKKELRFVSFNIPNLLYIEDYFPFKASNPWRLPTEFEIRDALKTIKELGGKVTRMYVLSVRRPGESKKIIRYVEGPGKFNERAFRTLDKVLQIANEEGVRVIIPFVDNWHWWGGKAEYAAFRGKKPDDFWTDPQLISDFEKTISFVLNRKNTYTGVLYKNDKSILGWETGNELNAPYEWHKKIAEYVKSIDKNHLVIVDPHKLDQQAVEDKSFDILTTHFYGPISRAETEIPEIKKLTEGKKPYFVGEFGYHSLKDVEAIVDTTIDNDLSGIMIW